MLRIESHRTLKLLQPRLDCVVLFHVLSIATKGVGDAECAQQAPPGAAAPSRGGGGLVEAAEVAPAARPPSGTARAGASERDNISIRGGRRVDRRMTLTLSAPAACLFLVLVVVFGVEGRLAVAVEGLPWWKGCCLGYRSFLQTHLVISSQMLGEVLN